MGLQQSRLRMERIRQVCKSGFSEERYGSYIGSYEELISKHVSETIFYAINGWQKRGNDHGNIYCRAKGCSRNRLPKYETTFEA